MSNPTDFPPPYSGEEKGSAPPYPGDPAGQPAGQQGYTQWGQPQQQQPAPGYQQPQHWQQQQQQQAPPQGGYPAVGTQPVPNAATTVHVLQTYFRGIPVQTQCPNCHNHVTTHVTYDPGAMAWLMCFIMFFIGLWCCCCIPFCIDGLNDADHHCPNCNHRIAHYSPL